MLTLLCLHCRILTVLRMNKHLWMNTEVVMICGFAATREWADQLLGNQPEGTFLVRPSMAMEATLVISVATRARVMHLAIDYRQLMDRALEVLFALPAGQYPDSPTPLHCTYDLSRAVHSHTCFCLPSCMYFTLSMCPDLVEVYVFRVSFLLLLLLLKIGRP